MVFSQNDRHTDQQRLKEPAAVIPRSAHVLNPRAEEYIVLGIVLLIFFMDVKNRQRIGQVMSRQRMVIVDYHMLAF